MRHEWVPWGCAVIMLLIAGMLAPASAAVLSAGDQQCLACHGMTGLEMPLTGGGTLALHIDGEHFAPSVHSALGCTGCHADINLASHPASVRPVASRRAFSIAMSQQVCGTCHSSEFQRWGESVHAALVREGNPTAPVCTDCHSPHTMIKGAAASMDTVPCKTCHDTIFAAYATSVHGVLRKGGLAAAPLCFNCHGAHDIGVPSAGAGRRDVCLGCHTEALASHRSWLPNVDLHFTVVSCPVCHTPQAQRVVDLTLYNSATQKEIPRPTGIPEFESLPESPTAARPGMDAATLMTLLGTLNRADVRGTTSIRGRLEVRTGIEDHQIAFAAKAISNCDTCHREGSAAFQSVEVSVAGPAGMPISYGVNKDVLEFGPFPQLGRWFLCHWRQQDHVSGCPFGPGIAGRDRRPARSSGRPVDLPRIREPKAAWVTGRIGNVLMAKFLVCQPSVRIAKSAGLVALG